jgi:phosphate uptake regulator
MAEEVHELHEHADHAKHDPSLVPVTFTMALLAVFVAAVSLLGHRTHTHELLLQNKATDQWAYFQAKNMRRHSYEVFADLLSVSETKDPRLAAQLMEKYKSEAERYRGEQKEIEAEARHLEQEVDTARREADRFDLGEVLLEAALVICSITLLTSRRIFWMIGVITGITGVVVALTGFWVH